MSFYEKVLKNDILNNTDNRIKDTATSLEKGLEKAIVSGETSYSVTVPGKLFAEELVDYLPHHPPFESDFKKGIFSASRETHITWESVDIKINHPPQ
jgi:hypothetical protein